MTKLASLLILASIFVVPLHAEPISCDEPKDQATDKDQIAAVQKALSNLKEPWQGVPPVDKNSDAYKADPQKAEADRSAALLKWVMENVTKKDDHYFEATSCSDEGKEITLPDGETIKSRKIDIYVKGKKMVTLDPIAYHYLMAKGKVNNGLLKFLAAILIGDGSQSAGGKAP